MEQPFKSILIFIFFITHSYQIQNTTYEVWDGNLHPVENVDLKTIYNTNQNINQVSTFFPNQFMDVNIDQYINDAYQIKPNDLDLRNENIWYYDYFHISVNQLYIEEISKIKSQQTVLIQLLIQNQDIWETSSRSKEIIKNLNAYNVKLGQLLDNIQQDNQSSSVYNNSDNLRCDKNQQKQQYELLQQLLNLKRNQEKAELQIKQKDMQIENLQRKNQEKEAQLQNLKKEFMEKENSNKQLQSQIEKQNQESIQNFQKETQELQSILQKSDKELQNCLESQTVLQKRFESQVNLQQQQLKKDVEEKYKQIQEIQKANTDLKDQFQNCLQSQAELQNKINEFQSYVQEQNTQQIGQNNLPEGQIDQATFQPQNQLEQQSRNENQSNQSQQQTQNQSNISQQNGQNEPNQQQQQNKNLSNQTGQQSQNVQNQVQDIQQIYEIVMTKLLEKQTQIGESDYLEMQGLLVMLIQKIQECQYRLQLQDNLTINIHQSNMLERLDYLNEQINRQEIIISSLQQRNQELQDINLELSQQSSIDTSIENKYKLQIEDLQEQADIALRQCKMLELSNDLINKANDELLHQNEQMQVQITQMQNERQKLRATNLGLTKQVSENQNQNLKQQNVISTLNLENNNLNLDFKSMVISNDQLYEQIQSINMILQKEECQKAAELRDYFAAQLSVLVNTNNAK